ncbi:MAG: exo-alpha-sialidase [Thermoplasmata archaeon]|nr:MAG: exo-alpha-sialidase [Thermoplasmata archaeon]
MRRAMKIVQVLMIVALLFAVCPLKMSARATDDRNYEAHFRAKPIGGTTWGEYTRLSYTPKDTRFVMVASNDKDPGHVVVVFAENLTGQYDWYFTESFDNGETWSSPAIAVNPSFDIWLSEIFTAAMDMGEDGVVHMTFARAKKFNTNQPTGIYYARYDGSGWSAPIPVQEEMSPGTLRLYTNDIKVGKDNNTIHVAYGSDYPGHDNGDTWYSKSFDGGNTWSTPVNINQDNGMDVGYRPSLAADKNGNVYKANDGGWPGWIWFRSSPDNGASWTSHMQIGQPSYEHRKPMVMCDNNGGVYMVYMREAPNEYTLMYKNSNDYGSTWIPSTQGGIILKSFIPGMGTWYHAELDDDGYIHIVHGSMATGIMEAYYMKIDTQGNIVVPSEIITPDDGHASYPTGLSLDGDNVYVTTRDYAPTLAQSTIDIDPNTLNLKSKGKWITCYIELPPGYDVKDINASTILLEDSLPPILDLKYGFVKSESSYIIDHDGDGILERMVKFDRSDVQDILSPGIYNLKVYGKLLEGTTFEGYSDEISVIDPS